VAFRGQRSNELGHVHSIFHICVQFLRLIVPRSTGKQPYELLYGCTVTIPNSFTKPPEPRYNYEDFHVELKQKLQVAHQIARDRLLE